jgi:mannose-6-phosphate isomerase-like protein (cupin superfamily)
LTPSYAIPTKVRVTLQGWNARPLKNYNRETVMIKYVHIKQRFDVVQMQQEAQWLEAELWKPHYNEKQYEGSWTILPLRSINGSTESNISIQGSALQNNMAYKDTPLLRNCSYLQSVLHFFECEKLSVRLMKLDAGAIIKEHADYDMSFEDGEARFHIPVLTNPGVDFFIEDEKILMKEGECWYLNLSLKHRVNNFGDTSRIHLVIDCKVNHWIRNLLNEEAELKKESSEKREGVNYSASDKIKIIEQLRLMGTPVADDMANKMEAGNN